MPLRPQTLKKYVELARPILIEVAKGKKREDRIITYTELKDEMGGPGRGYIGEVLEEVSDEEYEKSHTILSALVVRKDNQRPSHGFWMLRILPLSLRNASREEKIDHWKKEYKHTCEYWEKHDP